jgi:hypothetical protein
LQAAAYYQTYQAWDLTGAWASTGVQRNSGYTSAASGWADNYVAHMDAVFGGASTDAWISPKLDWVKPTSDFFAAWADKLTFGGTSWVRGGLGYDDAVNYNSTAYTAGSWVGAGHRGLLTVGWGWQAGVLRPMAWGGGIMGGASYGQQVAYNYQYGRPNPWTNVNFLQVADSANMGAILAPLFSMAPPAVVKPFLATVAGVESGQAYANFSQYGASSPLGWYHTAMAGLAGFATLLMPDVRPLQPTLAPMLEIPPTAETVGGARPGANCFLGGTLILQGEKPALANNQDDVPPP